MAAAFTLLIGTTLHDIRSIRREHAMRRHPHTRRWRARPSVAVTSSNISQLKRHYRHIVQYTNHRHTPYILSGDARLAPGALLEAVRALEEQPKLVSITLSPQLKSPETLLQLLHNYRIILSTPLFEARSGLGIAAPVVAPTVMTRATPRSSTQIRLTQAGYGVAAYVLKFLSLFLGCYALYLALAVAQPMPFTVIVCVLGAYTVYSVAHYRHFSVADKLAYTLLSPVCFPYIAICTAFALIRITLPRQMRRATTTS